MGNKGFIALRGTKNMIRAVEGFFEVLVISVLYYFVWRFGYSRTEFPPYLGYGKYVLAGLYALIVAILFHSFDSFQFGYLRLTEIVISQGISLFIANVITYFQLSLIANHMISPVRVLQALRSLFRRGHHLLLCTLS